MMPPRLHITVLILTEALKELGLSVSAALRIPGARRAMLSYLVNGNALLSSERGRRMEKAFGLSLDLLLRIQARYDAMQRCDQADGTDVRRYAYRLT